ncbi:hypothetical protein BSK65_24785 [Paenibacillus odorifer]|uniref:Uncharacterized protein n=1 Tax=Paenibacillus odorifer TaxID=189426 RepID=A0A1R0ZA94_9BACL|nr:hypothetical protein [Paenibacillus odorifer]OME65418.1 hypothetical protein BSK65_24785 [Paenibacillus odorifer]
MKRTAWIIVTLLLLLGSIPITASAKAPTVKSWKTLYSEYIKKTLMDATRDRSYDGDFNYFTLVDLNFDGTPELIQGYSLRFIQPINIALTVQNGKVIPFNYQGKLKDISEGIFNVGMGGFLPRDENRGLHLYKNKKDGTLRYIAFVDGSGSYNSNLQVFEISFQGTKFNDKEIFLVDIPDQEKTDDLPSYYVNQKEVNKSAYDKAYKQYFSNLTLVPSKVITANYTDLFNNEVNKFVPNGIANFINRYSSSK